MDLTNSWPEYTYVAFDIETSGAYPLGADVCEIAAVKWRGGHIVEEFQTLLKPRLAMSAFVIGIHGITNEMVQDAPMIHERIGPFRNFLGDAIPIAHHAPFDIGFMMAEFEQYGIDIPKAPVICSSLLSRKVIPESPNHRLQTLIEHLQLAKGTAHRALDDSRACLQVALKSMERMGERASLYSVLQNQGGPLNWMDFSLRELATNSIYSVLIESIRTNGVVEVCYEGGTKSGQPRTLHPKGIVRSPQGDFIITYGKDQYAKRFYLKNFISARKLEPR